MVDLWFSRRGGQYWQLVLALKANKGINVVKRGFTQISWVYDIGARWVGSPFLKCVVSIWALQVRGEEACQDGLGHFFLVCPFDRGAGV